MSLKNNIIRIWKSKNQIIEGITNSIFKKEDVEAIAEERLNICRSCPSKLFNDKDDSVSCIVPGTGPCCDLSKGGCGCSLGFKTRSMSAYCELEHWGPELSQEEEDNLNQKLGL